MPESDGDVWTSRGAEGAVLSPSVWLLTSPGHTREDITTDGPALRPDADTPR